MNKQKRTKLTLTALLILLVPVLNGCIAYDNPDAEAEMYSTLTVEEQQEIRERRK